MMKCIALVMLLSAASLATSNEDFLYCTKTRFSTYNTSLQIVFTPDSPLYTSLHESTQQNPRWVNSTRSNKPLVILTPVNESEIQAAITCSKHYRVQVRIRSGGHDYEGLSYRSKNPFIIIDMINFRSIQINIQQETAWVQSGATLGELYYAIAKKSSRHGFPAGLCPTVGIGGHFSGGGLGTLLRKYGLAADNVVDALIIDANERILDRKAMGEDLFWAIRGGGGASFGIILSWKVKLVRVPEIVTGFNVRKAVKDGGSKLVERWQHIAHKLHEDLFIRVIIENAESDEKEKIVQATFNSLFLGRVEKLIPIMNKSFPELGLKFEDCREMSWIESTLYFAGFQKGQPLEVLLDKVLLYKSNFKAKSDFVTKPIPEDGLKGIWQRFLQEDLSFLIMDPFGGKMNQISESEIPFPHRRGNLYNIQYLVKWETNGAKEFQKHAKWMRILYRYMEPYVSKSPRAAYLNYRDLDLGTKIHANTSNSDNFSWGFSYFRENFKRLIRIKSKVDPHNFFRNAQSIPVKMRI